MMKCLELLLLLLHLSYQVAVAQDTSITLNNRNKTSLEIYSSLDHGLGCQKDRIFTWCLPLDYNKKDAPWRYRDITNATFPWIYKFKFHIFEVQEVDDLKRTVRMSMYFTIRWLEPRINVNESAKDWNDTKYGLSNTVDIAPEDLKHFWNPDLEIYGMELFHLQSILKEMSSLTIKKTRTIEYMARVDIEISCQMQFDKYPLDEQQCPFRIGSSYSAEDTVICNETYDFNKTLQRSLQYSVQIGSLPDESRVFSHDHKRYAVCGVNILLRRKRKQIFYQVYLTSILFVVVSWVSFIIDPEVVPGRMALLVTMFLILINNFNSVKDNAPKSTTLNSGDLYLIVSVGMVFLALAEYAIVIFRKKYRLGRITSSGKNINPTSASVKEQKNKIRKVWKEDHSSTNKIDNLSLVLFPASFILFNVVYGILYI